MKGLKNMLSVHINIKHIYYNIYKIDRIFIKK